MAESTVCSVANTDLKCEVLHTKSIWQAMAATKENNSVSFIRSYGQAIQDKSMALLNSFINDCQNDSNYPSMDLCWDETSSCDVDDPNKEHKLVITELVSDLNKIESHTEESKLLTPFHFGITPPSRL